MGLFEKLKSALGLDGSGERTRPAETDVTVEREPSVESERAVKGANSTSGAGDEATTADSPRAPRSAPTTGGETDETDQPDETGQPDEPDETDEPDAAEAASSIEEAESEPAQVTDSVTDTAAHEPPSESADGEDATGGVDQTETQDEPNGSVADEPDTEPADEPSDAGTASVTVQEITGIGPTYADRLEAAGIGTVADLQDSDPETVADAAETSSSRADDWIDQAADY